MVCTVNGKLTDFSGHAIAGGDVTMLDKAFNPVYQAKTDGEGNYALQAEAGEYMALAGAAEYGVKYLECWNWNFLLDANMKLDMRVGGVELYSMNAFVPQGSAPKIMVYFRPSSLKRYLANKTAIDSGKKGPGAACCDMDACDIYAAVNGEKVKNFRYDGIEEVCDSTAMKCCLLQVEKPASFTAGKMNVIHIVVYDRKTEEYGEGRLFYRSRLI